MVLLHPPKATYSSYKGVIWHLKTMCSVGTVEALKDPLSERSSSLKALWPVLPLPAVCCS